jgi:hypothetical protein
VYLLASGEKKMTKTMVAARMPASLADELRTLAAQEAERRGEQVSVGTLLREGARMVLKQAKQRNAGPGHVA